jgi:hypothetical protein
MSDTTAAAQEQDWSYLFLWWCSICGGATRAHLDFCQTVDCGAARWWAEAKKLTPLCAPGGEP